MTRAVGREYLARYSGLPGRRTGDSNRASGGKVGGAVKGLPVLLLTTTGRKTGQTRAWPVGYLVDGDHLLVSASANGQPAHPAWYLNLRTNPRVIVEIKGATRAMRAEVATGEERTRLWSRLVREYPFFAGFQHKTTREIPVVILHPPTSLDGERAAPT